MDDRQHLLASVTDGLAQLSPHELDLFALAVLHGVPITKLPGSAQDNVDELIGAQKKLRKFLTEARCGIADLSKGNLRR